MISLGGLFSGALIPVPAKIRYEILGLYSDFIQPNHIFVEDDSVLVSDQGEGCVNILSKDLELIDKVCPTFQNGSVVIGLLQTIRLPNETFISILSTKQLITYHENGLVNQIIDLPVFTKSKYLSTGSFYQIGLDTSNSSQPVVIIKFPFGNDTSQVTTLSSILKNNEKTPNFINFGDGLHNIYVETEITYYSDHPVISYEKDNLIYFAILGWRNWSYGLVDSILPQNMSPGTLFYPNRQAIWFKEGMIIVTDRKLLNFYNSTGNYIESLKNFQGLGDLEEITSIQYDSKSETLYLTANDSIVSFRIISMEKEKPLKATTPLIGKIIASTNIYVLLGGLIFLIMITITSCIYILYRMAKKIRKKFKLEESS